MSSPFRSSAGSRIAGPNTRETWRSSRRTWRSHLVEGLTPGGRVGPRRLSYTLAPLVTRVAPTPWVPIPLAPTLSTTPCLCPTLCCSPWPPTSCPPPWPRPSTTTKCRGLHQWGARSQRILHQSEWRIQTREECWSSLPTVTAGPGRAFWGCQSSQHTVGGPSHGALYCDQSSCQTLEDRKLKPRSCQSRLQIAALFENINSSSDEPVKCDKPQL